MDVTLSELERGMTGIQIKKVETEWDGSRPACAESQGGEGMAHLGSQVPRRTRQVMCLGRLQVWLRHSFISPSLLVHDYILRFFRLWLKLSQMEDAFYSKNGNPNLLSYQLASCSWLSLEGQPKRVGMDTGGHSLSREESCASIPSPPGLHVLLFFFPRKKQVTWIFDKRVQYFK